MILLYLNSPLYYQQVFAAWFLAIMRKYYSRYLKNPHTTINFTLYICNFYICNLFAVLKFLYYYNYNSLTVILVICLNSFNPYLCSLRVRIFYCNLYNLNQNQVIQMSTVKWRNNSSFETQVAIVRKVASGKYQ